jgi:hypothetical protein
MRCEGLILFISPNHYLDTWVSPGHPTILRFMLAWMGMPLFTPEPARDCKGGFAAVHRNTEVGMNPQPHTFPLTLLLRDIGRCSVSSKKW